MRPGIFLDRDGVINDALVRDGRPFSPMSVDEFAFAPGVEAACERLAAIAPLIVVTNQPEIARGRLTIETVAAMHDKVRERLPITDILLCPHDRDDGCDCRKPKAGMLVEAALRHSLSLETSVIVGDRSTDIEAGQSVGCRTVLVGPGYDEPPVSTQPDLRAASLLAATPGIEALLDTMNR